jgi:hypothetical protein
VKRTKGRLEDDEPNVTPESDDEKTHITRLDEE